MAGKLTDVYDPSLPVFAIVWENGAVSAADGRRVSEMHDMADCDGMEGVKGVYAADADGKLLEIAVGESRKINTDQELPFRYATSPIMAGTRRVGAVIHTDH
jgi:hypothetical protein